MILSWPFSAHAQQASVEGVVLDSHSRITVADVHVTALDATSRDTLNHTTTDAHGRYQLDLPFTVRSKEVPDSPEYAIWIDGPNPVSSITGTEIRIGYSAPHSVAEPSAELYDIRGRVMRLPQVLPAGIYFVRLHFPDGRLSTAEKVVVASPFVPSLKVRRMAPPNRTPAPFAAPHLTADDVIFVVEKPFYHRREAPGSVTVAGMQLDWELESTIPLVTADEAVYEVTYQSDAIVLEGSGRAALVEADTASGRYRFDAAALDAAGVELIPGKVLLIEGISVRRIAAVQTSGGFVTVETDFATLEELIEDGDFGWTHTLRFDEEHLPNFSVAGKNAQLQRSARKIELSYKADPYEIKIELVPSDTSSSAEIKAEVTKTLASGLKARLTGIARIKEMKSSASASFRSGKLESVSYETTEQEIEILLDIAAAGPGIDENDIGFIVPQALFRYVFMVGLFPVQTDFKLQFVFRVKVDPNASALARTRLRYTADAGLQYTGTDIEVNNVSAQVTLQEGTADAASVFMPVDLQFGVAFPRIEVSLVGVPIVPYFRTGFFIGSTLRFGPICKTAFQRVALDAGLEIKLFTPKPITLLEATMWEHRVEEKSDGCPADKNFDGDAAWEDSPKHAHLWP
jgi:hypothetical protein